MILNVYDLIKLANHHPRVNILQPGPGVGGHCIAVDPWFIVSAVPNEARLIACARFVNDSKPIFVANKISEALTVKGSSAKIACLGLAFKPNIDDLRESPSLQIVEELVKNHANAQFLIVEPHISELPLQLKTQRNIKFSNLKDAIKEADIVAVLVGHSAFSAVKLSDLVDKVVIDVTGKIE